MKIWHRIGFHRLDNVDEILDSLKIKYVKSPLPGDSYTLTFDIHEDDLLWPEIKRLVQEKSESGYLGFVYTSFEKEEILAAEWVRLCTGFKRYYPQPERNMKYVKDTFRRKCSSCGLEFDQKAPFRIKKEAKLGKYDFVSLYWTYGIFATQYVIEKIQIAGLKGIEVWPVMLHREDKPSDVISQLLFPHVAGPGLDEKEKVDPEPCSECGITKYAFHNRGYMHLKRASLLSDVDAQHTYEWFGSDTKWGFQEILISNRFARMIIEEKWKGVVLKPVKLI